MAQLTRTQNAPAATIAKAQDSVTVHRDGQDMSLQQGDALYNSDIIITTDTPVELAFQDGSTASLGPQTKMHLKDFVFDNENPSFVMELAIGTMRTISGAIVEQNPDAFKVVTPRATVGIRGTDFVTTVNTDSSEQVVLLTIDQGHNLVLTTHDGSQISLTSALQGAFLGSDADASLQPRTFTEEEIQDLVNTLKSIFAPQQDENAANEQGEDEENKALEEETYANDNTLLLLDEALLGQANAQDLADALAQAGVNVGILSAPPPAAEDSGGNNKPDDDLYPEHEGDEGHGDYISIDGKEDFFADGHHATDQLISHNIVITDDVSNVVVLSGDTDFVSEGTVIGGHDTFTGQSMSNGTIVGDAISMTSGTLTSGNDTISLHNKTGGQSIYGDVKEITGGTVTLGDDNITLSGTFTNSTISGDAAHVGHASVTRWGNDSITIEGDMGDASGASTVVYGDASEIQDTDAVGGDDSIIVNGTMHGGTYIDAGLGNDTISVNNMQSGAVLDAGSGADIITVNGAQSGAVVDMGDRFDPASGEQSHDGSTDKVYLSGTGSVTLKNFDTDSDELYIDGSLHTVTGDGTYGGYEITFDNFTGNLPPEAPATGSGSVIEAGLNSSPDAGSHNGSVGATDVNGDPLTYSVGTGDDAPKYGTVTFNGDNYTYVLNDANNSVNGLAAGDTLQDSFTIIVSDGKGGTVEQSVTINITGSNDAPTLEAADITIDEDIASPYQVSGTAAGEDVDTGARLIYSIKADDLGHVGIGSYGNLSIDSNSGTYTYTLRSDLGLTEATQETFTIVVTDEHGASAEKEITVHITADDDAPLIENTLATGTDNAVTEDDSADNIVQGTLNISDPDTQGVTFTITGTDNPSAELASDGEIINDYGTFTLVTNSDGTHSYTFTLNNGAPAVQSLNAGETKELTYTVKASDGNKETTEEIKIVINGADEPPLPDVTGSVTTSDTSISTKMEVTIFNLPEGVSIDATRLPTSDYGTFSMEGEKIYFTQTKPLPHAAGEDSATLPTAVFQTQNAYGVTGELHVTVTITDDAPTPENDTANVTEGDEISGNILSNDASGADGWKEGGALVGVTAPTSWTQEVTTDGSFKFTANEGTITLHPNGDYTFNSTSDTISTDANFEFTCTVQDSDGDQSQAILKVTTEDVTIPEATASVATSDTGLNTKVEVTIDNLPAGVSVDTTNLPTSEYGIFSVEGEKLYFTQTKVLPHAAGEDSATLPEMTFTTTDSDGNTGELKVTVTITDAVPTANNDTANVTEGDEISGNILSNDASGADGWKEGGALVGVTAPAGWTQEPTTDGSFKFTANEGTITFHPNGNYTFKSTGDTLSVNTKFDFTCTVQDSDGDQSQASLTVTTEDVTIPDATASVTTSDTNIGAKVGITINNLPDGVSIDPTNLPTSEYGTFSVEDDKLYFTQTKAYPHGQASASATLPEVTFTTTDAYGNKGELKVTVTITDDAPAAQDDTASLTEGYTISGNVLGGATAGAGDMADDAGADGWNAGGALVNVTVPADWTQEPTTDGSFKFNSDMGTITFSPNGDYTFKSSSNSLSADASFEFSYTVQDGDGDQISATLTVNVTNTEGDIRVYTEADLKALSTEQVLTEHDDTSQSFGNTTFLFPDGIPSTAAGGLTFVGDSNTLAEAESRVGGSDSFIITGNISTNAVLIGDTQNLSNTPFGTASDIFTVTGNSQLTAFYGDASNADNMLNTPVNGADIFSIDGALQGGSMYGDVYNANASTISGNDTFSLGSMTGGSIYSDASKVSGDSTINGGDYIKVHGAMDDGTIYGDVRDVYAGRTTLSGQDIIHVEGHVGGSAKIVGDVSSISSNVPESDYNLTITGHDIIHVGSCAGDIFGDIGTITQTLSGSFNVNSTGHDIITVNGYMSGNIYADVQSISTASPSAFVHATGDDIITVHGALSGTIHTGRGQNIVHAHGNVTGGGTITVEENGNDVIFLNADGQNIVTLDLSKAHTNTLIVDASSLGSDDSIHIMSDADANGSQVYFVGLNASNMPSIYLNNGTTNGEITSNVSTALGGEAYIDSGLVFHGEAPTTYDTASLTAGDHSPDARQEQPSPNIIYINGNMSQAGANIYGDGPDFDSNRSESDIIILNGNMQDGAIIGDVSNAQLSSGTSSDIITIKGNMTGGNVYGDAINTTGASSVNGADTITVYGDMTGGTIYGDVQNANGTGVTITGNDTIIIEGNMSGTAVIATDINLFDNPGLVDGDDKVFVNGIMSGGDISTAAGDDTVIVNEMSGGAITTDTGDDRVIIKGQMSNGFIDLGAGNDMLIIGSPDAAMTKGEITGTFGDDHITLYIGEAAKDAITLTLDKGDKLILHDEATGETNVTVSGLTEGTTFWVDGTAVTAGASGDSITYGAGLIVHFTS